MDPVHIGLEHPNALWLGAVGLVSFAAGAAAMAVSRRRRGVEAESARPAAGADATSSTTGDGDRR